MTMDKINKNFISWRAIFLGMIFSLMLAVGEPYGVALIKGSPLCADFSTGGAIFLFFILVIMLNPLLKVVGKRLGLNREELLVIYIMLIVAAAIPSWGFSMNLPPILAGITYYATPENKWAELILPHIPKWLIPADSEVIREFFEGLPPGSSIPWHAWMIPLLAWGSLILAVYFVSICIITIFRKQWIEKERLLFPLVQLPMEMVQSESSSGERVPLFFKNKLVWLGVAIPFVINSINALHRYFHFIPPIQLTRLIKAFQNTLEIPIHPWFEVIGLSYLLSLDVSLSIWFFALLAIIQKGIFGVIGFNIGPIQPYSDPGPPSIAHQALGSLFVLVLASLWTARYHIREVFSKAFTGNREVDDTDEPISYRTAVFGLILGLLFIGGWLMASGLRFGHMLIFLVSGIFIFIGLTKIVAQTGLAYARAPVAPPIFTVNSIGSSALGAAGLISLGLSFSWIADTRTLVMASAANGLKISGNAKITSRRIGLAFILAILISLIGSLVTTIFLAYRHGGLNLGSWQFSGLSSYAGKWIAGYLHNPQGIAKAHLGFIAIGGSVMTGLIFMRNHFLWWPLHPIGYTLGLTYPIYCVWFSVMIAWLIKFIVLKYGGARVYRQLRPFFLGLILGSFVSAGFWLIVDFFTGMTGNYFTLG